MLRLRPIRTTEHFDAWTRLLKTLGFTLALDLGDRLEFDSPQGRVALHLASAAGTGVGGTAGSGTAGSGADADAVAGSGATRLAFEVGDLDEFARRTREAGTGVVINESSAGRTAVIAAPDGLEMIAAVEKERPEPARSPVRVMPVWTTADVDGAARTLRNLGAKTLLTGDGWTQLRAKNGGFVGVRAGSATGIELAFEYDGDAESLAGLLATAGLATRVTKETTGRTVAVADPDGGADIRIAERSAAI